MNEGSPIVVPDAFVALAARLRLRSTRDVENGAMPRKPSPEKLETFVRRQDAVTLADVLLELAAEHDDVRKRLERLALSDQPKALATAFRKSLAGWKRSTRFFGYAEARHFGRELEHWLDQVERELLPKDPMQALDLVESFVKADAAFFERADDSDGAIGDAVRAGCRLWLRCAARCEAPAAQWPDRITALFDADDYGAREPLLRQANLLLDEPALRAMVAGFEQRLDRLLAEADATPERRTPSGIFHLSAALSLLSEALQDPDVHVAAVLRYSPQPNPMQKEGFVHAYLKVDRPADALRWLDGSWDHQEDSRRRWLAQALHRLGRTEEAADTRQRIFERTLEVSDLHAWMELLPPAAQGQAASRARALAERSDDPMVVARLWLDLGDDAAAEQALVTNPKKLRGGGYGLLLPLAKTLEERALWAGTTVVYRQLLLDILERAYTPAYRHGAKYWVRLLEIASQHPGLTVTPSPATFEAEVRLRHGRKSSFWAQVSAATGATQR